MSFGLTFGWYMARRSFVAILCVFLVCATLVYAIDFVELLRRAGDSQVASTGSLGTLAALRVPGLALRILPFAVLFGAMIAFVTLSRRLELVVARSSGISVWQFIAPAVLVAVLLGLFATFVADRLAFDMQNRADDMEARLLSNRPPGGSQGWIRQKSVDGQAIIHASASAAGGRQLKGVTVFTFNEEGGFEERIEAPEAVLGDGVWELRDARVLAVGQEPRTESLYLLATSLTPRQLEEGFETPDVPFAQLADAIELAERSGLPTTGLYLRREMLLAQPLLFAAMVLIAASVSLRLARLGSVAPAIAGGVAAGFVLYVGTKLAEDLGAAGLVGPAAAAWLPALLGVLMSITVLLHLEDG